MEKGSLDEVEDNVVVRACVTQDNLQELKEILDQWNNEGVTPVLAILVETFRSLMPAREWVKVDSSDVLSFYLFGSIVTFGRSIRGRQIEAPWLHPDEILYRCGNFDWVPLLGIWGAVGYASLLVRRQYRSRQFIPATHRLAKCEFSYKCDSYKRKIREMSNAWNQTRRMKRLAMSPMTIPEYNDWRTQNEVLKKSSSENQKEKDELKNRVTELERSLHWRQNRNSVMELKASLSKIEEMKEMIEELEMALQNCDIWIKYLEANEDRQNEQLHHL
ncbi:hypothetical protein Golax_023417 [Gossypium laxum]|uniref:DUF7745 domain-containing protein n=1 Tax=Gossypium laxum TaxID=34288 RepID=A0A7J9B3L3_9ROSI|nr:hypothetical protein [Gossypium laxum]